LTYSGWLTHISGHPSASCKSSAGQRKHIGQRPMLYRWTTQPTRCVRWGPSSPFPKGGGGLSPQFSAHICCGQMAGWIKMPLGMEEGLGPGDFVLDGDPAPLPNFRPMSVAKRLGGSRYGTWHRGGPWSRLHCARLGPAPLPKKGGRTLSQLCTF